MGAESRRNTSVSAMSASSGPPSGKGEAGEWMMGRRGIPRRVEGEPGMAKRARGDEGIIRGEVRAKSRSGLGFMSLGRGRRRREGREGAVRAGSGSCRSSKSGRAAPPPLSPAVPSAAPFTPCTFGSSAPPMALNSLPFISPHNYLLINLLRESQAPCLLDA